MQQQKIGFVGGALLLIFAASVDFVQFVITFILTFSTIGAFLAPFVSTLITVPASLILGIWLSHYGAGSFKPKNVSRFLGTLLGEIIPIINDLPLWFIWTLVSIRLHNRDVRLQTQEQQSAVSSRVIPFRRLYADDRRQNAENDGQERGAA